MQGGSPLLKRDGDSKYPPSYLHQRPDKFDLLWLHRFCFSESLAIWDMGVVVSSDEL